MLKRFIAALLTLGMGLGFAIAVGTASAASAGKAWAFHNGHLISISCNAAPAHVAHGDKVFGKCRKF